MAQSSILGYPRMGPQRELKKALESYWKGGISDHELRKVGNTIRSDNWRMMKAAGVNFIPSNDFSFYDTILDLTCTLGLVPERYQWNGFEEVPLDTYFAMARGMQRGDTDVTAMEMSKWFDTNYHYIVPEFETHMNPRLSSRAIFHQFAEAAALGIKTRPVIVGPASFALLGKPKHDLFDHAAFVKSLVPVYNEIFQILESMGCEWVQLDEPFLCMDLTLSQQHLFTLAYQGLRWSTNTMKVMTCTYMEVPRENMGLLMSLPVQGVHIDLCRVSGKANSVSTDPVHVLEGALSAMAHQSKILSVGIVDGRNVWKNDMRNSIDLLLPVVAAIGPFRLIVSTSCSLLHCPVDIDVEVKMDPEVRDWLVFAKQKVTEVLVITKGISKGEPSIEAELAANKASLTARAESVKAVIPAVRERVAGMKDLQTERVSAFPARHALQKEQLKYPLFPTTTIGSFPQTDAIRKARALFRKGGDKEAYEESIQQEIENVVKLQEDLGLDVLVHGEPERTDMVEHFGQLLTGFIFSEFGWVQSYGSRCVKPPILFGDVSREHPMTVEWSKFAQSKTEKPMKGMLTGPITILQWSFVRDDQPRKTTATQLALAIRDEVKDLEEAGIKIIQIDEAAIREGLPLRKSDWEAYLKWAVHCFKIAASVAADHTQIHTHMCYSEFNDIIGAIASMDADVISIETSRSHMELLDAFVDFEYPNSIGPGVYDIHSPRVPSEVEMLLLLKKAAQVLPVAQLWVNPDCGLKTRGYTEVKEALANMVSAAKSMRKDALAVMESAA